MLFFLHLLFFRADDRKNFFNFSAGICNSETDVLDRVWIRRMQKAVSICVRTLLLNRRASLKQSFHPHLGDGMVLLHARLQADRMQISSGLITRHAYYMRSQIARNANQKSIYMVDDKKKLSFIDRCSFFHVRCRSRGEDIK